MWKKFYASTVDNRVLYGKGVYCFCSAKRCTVNFVLMCQDRKITRDKFNCNTS